MKMGDYHGDEPEIESELNAAREAYLEEHADDWKYEEDRFMDKPPLGIEPRHFWLKRRTEECCDAIFRVSRSGVDWEGFRDLAKDLATELLYCVTEWEKFYPSKGSQE